MRTNIFKYKLLILSIILCFLTQGCQKYLDKKPDKTLVVPTTINDASLLLDFYNVMNNRFPYLGAISDGDIYILDNIYSQIPVEDQKSFTWAKDAIANDEWSKLYQIVSHCNVALETLANLEINSSNEKEYNRVKGSALFYRAYAFYHIVQYYAEPYVKETAPVKNGISLRLNSDINVPNTRASLEETYQRIIADLKDASHLLPISNLPPSRPNRAAAFAALARTYLAMEEYDLAKINADSCLALYNTLMDYNTSGPGTGITSIYSNNPFELFNPEVIFQAVNVGAGITRPNIGIVDSLLFNSYASGDLRQIAFFRSLGQNRYGFKGNYNGSTNGANFSGIAVDEILLIRAECNARSGNVAEALNDLDSLLVKRWASGTFTPTTATDADDALTKILNERRKELVGRGIRWFDLRRLNKDIRFAKTLERSVNGQNFSLAPNDPRYTFYIPQQVIELTGMPQNIR